MGRPLGTYGKVARVFGVTPHAVRKWKAQGCPFRSTDGLLCWLSDQWLNRTAENFNLRCMVLWGDLHHALARERRPPRKRVNGILQPRSGATRPPEAAHTKFSS
jgi:hypothetical protein